ncbi:DUF397 domain-containing protein [Micromonospora rubida]
MATPGRAVAVRDSKDPAGPVPAFDRPHLLGRPCVGVPNRA